jgi:hypothetical protein
MDKVYIIVKMEINTKDNGEMMRRMVMGKLITVMAYITLVLSKTMKNMVMEFRIGQMETDTKDNGIRINFLEKEHFI